MNQKKYTAAYKLCIFSTVILGHTTFLGMGNYDLNMDTLDLNKTILQNLTAPFKGGEEYQNHLKRLKNPVILELINTEIEVLLERLQRKHKGIQIPRPLKKRKEENNTLQKINNYVGPKPTIIQKKISCLKTSDHRKNAPAKEYPKRTCTKRYQRAFTKNNLMTLLFINSLCIL